MTSPDQPSNPPLRQSVATIAAAAITDLDPVWRLPRTDIIPALFDVVPGVVQKWNLASASVAADWYDSLREEQGIAGSFTAFIPDLGDQGSQALAGWGAEALKTVPAQEHLSPSEMPITELDDPADEARYRVEGGLQKRLINAANLTITESSRQDPHASGYMRRTRPDACKFCVMVASRGAVYTKASATFACHEHCYCEAVPAWGGQPLPVGPYKPSDRPSTAADRARVRRWIATNL